MPQLRVRYTEDTGTGEFLVWCREYQKFGNFQCNALKRFAIAFYQIHQGIAWHGTPNEHEAFMACVVHLTCMCEDLDVDVYPALMVTDLTDLPSTSAELDYKKTLISLSKIQQMVVYQSTQYSRSSRYKKKIVQTEVAELIRDLLGRIPKRKRKDALYNATSIMTGEL